MIFLLGGTADSLEIGQALKKQHDDFCLSVVSDYGEELAKELDCPIIKQRLNQEAMSQCFKANKIDLVLDATHPFAEEVSKNAIAVCQQLNLDYLRYERPPLVLPNTISVASIQEACAVASQFGGVIYLTTGSKSVATYLNYLPLEQLVVRVLPVGNVIKEIEAFGFQAHQIEGLKGPFTTEMNLALLKRNRASVMISKESGTTGGLIEKAAACEAANIPCVIIQRKKINYPKQVESLEALLLEIGKVRR